MKKKVMPYTELVSKPGVDFPMPRHGFRETPPPVFREIREIAISSAKNLHLIVNYAGASYEEGLQARALHLRIMQFAFSQLGVELALEIANLIDEQVGKTVRPRTLENSDSE